MNFTHYDLGQLAGGEIIEVNLEGTAANVRLLDSLNFSAYRAGQRHQYFGGHATWAGIEVPFARAYVCCRARIFANGPLVA